MALRQYNTVHWVHEVVLLQRHKLTVPQKFWTISMSPHHQGKWHAAKGTTRTKVNRQEPQGSRANRSEPEGIKESKPVACRSGKGGGSMPTWPEECHTMATTIPAMHIWWDSTNSRRILDEHKSPRGFVRRVGATASCHVMPPSIMGSFEVSWDTDSPYLQWYTKCSPLSHVLVTDTMNKTLWITLYPDYHGFCIMSLEAIYQPLPYL